MDDQWTPWILAGPWVWISTILAVSIIVRRRQGKPILPRTPKGAVFSERMASGWSDGWRALGGARNCLMVWIDRDALTIVPFFPFNLMFFGTIWGLEQTIPRRDVIRVERHAGILHETIVVTYRQDLGTRRFTLVLRKSEVFVRLLNRSLAAIPAG
jgi:hypothetical protein